MVECASALLDADRNHIPSTFVWLSGTLMYQTQVECHKVFYLSFLLVVSFRLTLLAPSLSKIQSPVDRRGRAGPGLSAFTIALPGCEGYRQISPSGADSMLHSIYHAQEIERQGLLLTSPSQDRESSIFPEFAVENKGKMK